VGRGHDRHIGQPQSRLFDYSRRPLRVWRGNSRRAALGRLRSHVLRTRPGNRGRAPAESGRWAGGTGGDRGRRRHDIAAACRDIPGDARSGSDRVLRRSLGQELLTTGFAGIVLPLPRPARRDRGGPLCPQPLPGARTVHGTASGEIWFRGFETEDSLSPWYAVSRDGTTPGLRRVLLPPGFSATDATDTHVLGIRRDELGVEYVVGRRLVPLAASGSSEGG